MPVPSIAKIFGLTEHVFVKNSFAKCVLECQIDPFVHYMLKSGSLLLGYYRGKRLPEEKGS